MMDNNDLNSGESIYKLFKFSSINKNLIDSLINEYIYCASPASLNDPFDCKVDVNDSIERAIIRCKTKNKLYLQKLVDNEKLMACINNVMKNSGICSFTYNLLNPIMWTHYSNEHKGICLMYEFPSNFITEKNDIFGIIEVKYDDNRITNWFLKNSKKLSSLAFEDIAMEVTKIMFSSKGIEWKYEKEQRILSRSPNPITIKKKYLTQICFGLDTPVSDRNIIYKIIEKLEYKPIFCEIKKSNKDFTLNAIDIIK